MRFNREANLAGQARLASLLGRPLGTGAPVPAETAEAAEWTAQWVEKFYQDMGMPTRLRQAGVPRKDIGAVAQDALTDFGMHRNVRRVKEVAELVELLERMW
jgi:alcohol dehydrogenase class IV